MAYCKECGAYIPDGHSKCLACGYDEAENKNTAEKKSSAYQYKYESREDKNDFLRRELEEQRRRQQENSRKWAETEKAQREKVKAEQYTYSHEANTVRSTDNKKYSRNNGIDSSVVFSAMSYFGILFVVPYILCKNDGFALFHAKQGLILFLSAIVAQALASILGLGWLVSIARIYFIYKGVKAVLNNKMERLPYIGGLL